MYAAYGSNMDPAQMAERCPHSPQRGTGWLKGWRLTFGGEDIGWEGALATVVEDAGQRVFVVLYEISEHDERVLDRWTVRRSAITTRSGCGFATLDGDVVAWLYVLDAGAACPCSYLGMSDAAGWRGASRLCELAADPALHLAGRITKGPGQHGQQPARAAASGQHGQQPPASGPGWLGQQEASAAEEPDDAAAQ
jgi:hypothetical protein